MRILGLDLGTQSSSFALFDQGKVTVLPLDSNVSTPSLVLHEPSGEVVVGKEAAVKAQQNPQDCYTSILRLLGARKHDIKDKHCLQNLALAPQVHNEQALRPNRGLPKALELEPELWVDEGYQLRSPSFIVAELLKRLFNQAASSISEPIDKLVITCPNYFNALQRQALLDAAKLANLPCPYSLLSENTAQALYLGHTLFAQLKRQQSSLNDCLVLMYNWSASKFECSLVALNYDYAARNPQSPDNSAGKAGLSADIDKAAQSSSVNTNFVDSAESGGGLGTGQHAGTGTGTGIGIDPGPGTGTGTGTGTGAGDIRGASQGAGAEVGTGARFGVGAGKDTRAESEAGADAGKAGDACGRGMVEILATLAKTELGGDELTWAIVDLLLQEFSYRYQVDLSGSKLALQRLFTAAEQAKIELSKASSTEILVPYLTKVKDQDLHLKFVLTQEQLVNAVYKPFIRKTLEICYKCLDLAGLNLEQVSQVLMLGGVCKMPVVWDELRYLMSQRGQRADVLRFERFDCSSYVPKFIDLDASLAPGACGAALSCEHPQIELVECLPYAIGVGAGEHMQTVLPRFAPLPASESQMLTVLEYSKDPLGNLANLGTLSSIGALAALGPLGSPGNNLAAFYKREPEEEPKGTLGTLGTLGDFGPLGGMNDRVKGGQKVGQKEAKGPKATVTVCLNQGKSTLAVLTLPHVTLVPSEGMARRRVGGLFMNESLSVAQVKLTLKVDREQVILVTLTDAHNPSVTQSYVLPVTTLSNVEIARMQQELDLRYLVDAKTQQVKQLSQLSTPEILSYVDNHPELQPFLTKLNITLPHGNSATSASSSSQAQASTQAQAQAPAKAQASGYAAAQAQAQGPVRSQAQDAVLSQSPAQAQGLCSSQDPVGKRVGSELGGTVRQDKAGDSELSLEILGQAVSQNFAEQITEILRKATSDLSTYHECNQALEDLKDLLKVALQELTRFKQQSEQELTKTKKFAIEGLLNDLLPVYDALDQAVLFGKEREIDAAILQGQTQTLELFTRTLQQHGVLVEDPTGKLFDPKFHQAISLIESTEVEPKHVAKTLQKGWILNERVVRPAQVIVAKVPDSVKVKANSSASAQASSGLSSSSSDQSSTPSPASTASQSISSGRLDSAKTPDSSGSAYSSGLAGTSGSVGTSGSAGASVGPAILDGTLSISPAANLKQPIPSK